MMLVVRNTVKWGLLLWVAACAVVQIATTMVDFLVHTFILRAAC